MVEPLRPFGKKRNVLLTAAEVSKYLRIHPTTLYRLLKTHQLQAFKIGKDWRISSEAMNLWLEEMQANPTNRSYTAASISGESSDQNGNVTKSHRPKPRD